MARYEQSDAAAPGLQEAAGDVSETIGTLALASLYLGNMGGSFTRVAEILRDHPEEARCRLAGDLQAHLRQLGEQLDVLAGHVMRASVAYEDLMAGAADVNGSLAQ